MNENVDVDNIIEVQNTKEATTGHESDEDKPKDEEHESIMQDIY